MGYIEPTTTPIYYAVTGTMSGEAVAISGMTQVGDATGVANALSVASDTDEVAFIGAVPVDAWPELPGFGEWLEVGDIYQYDGTAVMVRQSHYRTIYDPADTPALFIVWREDAEACLDWVAGEQVYVGTRRVYDGVEYECLQAHVTQADWTPPATPALWRIVPDEPVTDEWTVGVAYAIGDRVTYADVWYTCLQAHTATVGWEPPTTPALWAADVEEPDPDTPLPWVQPTGAHDAYNIGDRVLYGGEVWESIINANVWAPGVYGWVRV